MRIKAAVFLSLLCGTISVAQTPGVSEGPPRGSGKVTGAFELPLDPQDKLLAVQGTAECFDLWSRHILAARKSVVLAGGNFPAIWLSAVRQLREQRPEVTVTVLIDRGSLGKAGEVAEQLVNAGVKVHFSSSIATMAGWPEVPALRGLMVVRDEASVLSVAGLSNHEFGAFWVQGWLLECVPLAKELSTRLTQLQTQLPPFPQNRPILLNDTNY